MLLNCGVGEDSWESLGLQGDQASQSWNQSWIFIGRTDAEAETPTLWPPDVKNWLLGKDPDAEKDWRREEKGTTEEEMVGWHHHLTWISVNSGSWWWTGRPGVLQSIVSQRIGHDWVTEMTELNELNDFLDMPSDRTHEINIDKLNFIKIKNFWSVKDSVKRMGR